jgi:hypothetical protein
MDEPLVQVAPGPLAAGMRLGPYEILDAIGAGGMGQVYRAREGAVAVVQASTKSSKSPTAASASR